MALHVESNLALTPTPDLARWPAPAALEPAHDERAQFAAQFIPAGARVLELNCGRMALRRFLPNGCRYQGCDLIAREPDTLTCDLNAGEFPAEAAREADVIVMLGVLEHIVDVESLFTHLRFARRDVIVSYCATDLTGKCDRAALGWVNGFSFFDLVTLFDRYGFRIECTAPLDSVQLLMRLTPAEKLAPVRACSVAVVAGGSGFGGRLARHMLNALLPGEADIHYLNFRTLDEARDRYDLVVVGDGGSLPPAAVGDGLMDLLARGRASIGLFGTQYRELMPRAGIERLIGRLDCWFARHQDDILMYGRGRKNVRHLGDWLIEAFPLATSSDADQLRVGEELDGEPAGRAIAAIQRHKAVFATRPHALLCALTAAEMAAYADEPSPDAPGIASGTFRSMLIDIFGRSYPERDFFLVDREAVARYKAAVHRNVAALRERIEATLRNVVVATL
ncbi:MAG TPA: methyltransferase domain-containing protein [Pseudolabrys sp.]|nr:methyltransferase domain-containing protein [Pseudolabrys sp.]